MEKTVNKLKGRLINILRLCKGLIRGDHLEGVIRGFSTQHSFNRGSSATRFDVTVKYDEFVIC